jgi:hypothetical protein
MKYYHIWTLWNNHIGPAVGVFAHLRAGESSSVNTLESVFFVLVAHFVGFYGTVVMSKHHPDLIMCRKQPGTTVGRLCDKCEGKCVMCDSLVRQTTLARICEECNYGSFQVRIRSLQVVFNSWRANP